MTNNELIFFTALCNNRNENNNVAVTHDLLDSIRHEIYVPPKYKNFSFSSVINQLIKNFNENGVLETLSSHIFKIINPQEIEPKSHLGHWYLKLCGF